MSNEFDSQFTETEQPSGSVRAEITGDIVTAEEFSIDDVDFPTKSVQPFEEFPITVTYSSDIDITPTTFDVNTNHADYCDPNTFSFYPGAELFVRVSSAVTETFGPGCYNADNLLTGEDHQATLNVVAQDFEGTQEIVVELVGQNTLQVYDTWVEEINVSEAADEVDQAPDSGDGNGNGDGDGDSDWVIDLPDRLLPEIGAGSGVVIGVGAVFVLLILLLAIQN